MRRFRLMLRSLGYFLVGLLLATLLLPAAYAGALRFAKAPLATTAEPAERTAPEDLDSVTFARFAPLAEGVVDASHRSPFEGGDAGTTLTVRLPQPLPEDVAIALIDARYGSMRRGRPSEDRRSVQITIAGANAGRIAKGRIVAFVTGTAAQRNYLASAAWNASTNEADLDPTRHRVTLRIERPTPQSKPHSIRVALRRTDDPGWRATTEDTVWSTADELAWTRESSIELPPLGPGRYSITIFTADDGRERASTEFTVPDDGVVVLTDQD